MARPYLIASLCVLGLFIVGVIISLALFLDAPCNGYSSGCYGSHNLAGLVIGIIVVPVCIGILLISFLVIWIFQSTNDLDDEQPQDSFICLVPTAKPVMAQDSFSKNQPGSRLVLVRCAYQKYKLCIYLWEPDTAEGDCVVCGIHVESEAKARVLPCKHTIHLDCLKTHMKRRIQCLACEAGGIISQTSFLRANLTSDSIDFHLNRVKQSRFHPQQYTCSFCHDEVRTGSEIRKPLCGHLFHSTCMGAWLVQQKWCPKCPKVTLATHDVQARHPSGRSGPCGASGPPIRCEFDRSKICLIFPHPTREPTDSPTDPCRICTKPTSSEPKGQMSLLPCGCDFHRACIANVLASQVQYPPCCQSDISPQAISVKVDVAMTRAAYYFSACSMRGSHPCSYCNQVIKPGSAGYILPCGANHEWHLSCLALWVMRTAKCPECDKLVSNPTASALPAIYSVKHDLESQ